MNLLEVIVLGLVQGLTEFIPVSSSGHLVIVQALFGHASDHLFLEAINIGTFLALLVYFFKRIVGIVTDIFKRRNYTLARNIIITSVPAGAIGYLLAGFIDATPFFSNLIVVAIALALIGLVMVLLEKIPRLSHVDDGGELTSGRALTIGLAQVAALIPGVSRSGSTIVTGRLMGLSAKEAAEYSFLASLPIMAGVTLKIVVENSDYLAANAGNLVIGNLIAFVSGLLAVGFLLRYLATRSLAIFGWYRIGLAAVVVAVLLVQLVT